MLNVLITGAEGFLGQYLVKEALRLGYWVHATCHYNDEEKVKINNSKLRWHICDLCDLDDVIDTIRTLKPTYIIHSAGFNGGINFNLKYPHEIYSNNVRMGLNLFDAISHNQSKILSIVASCAYDSEQTYLYGPEFLNGKPHESVLAHGYAKRSLQILTTSAAQQYGLNASTACITTLYGPGDSLDLNKTKVMMSLIKKIVDAKQNKTVVEIWGDGTARRQFIFVEDAARCLLSALRDYNNSSEPANISPKGDISIKSLVELICDVVGFDGKVQYDTSKPSGQLKKELVPHPMFDDYPFTSLRQGIINTVQWYQKLKT